MGFVMGGGMKLLLRIDEVAVLLSCSKRHVYNLIDAGHLTAHHPHALPGKKGLRVVSTSVASFVEKGIIPPDDFLK